MTHWLARWWRDVSEVPTPWPPMPSPPEDKGELAAAAKRLLEDPMFHLAMARMQQKAVETWKVTGADQLEGREAAYWLYQASERLKGEVQKMAGDAAMSQRAE